MELFGSPAELLASVLVVLTGLYFLGLAVASFRAPARAAEFLLGFAASSSAHYLELAIRLAIGGAFLLHAPRMLFSGAFVFFGWAVMISSAALLVVPWRWHSRYAQMTVPYAVRYIRAIGAASLVIGAVVLAATIVGPA